MIRRKMKDMPGSKNGLVSSLKVTLIARESEDVNRRERYDAMITRMKRRLEGKSKTDYTKSMLNHLIEN